MTSLYATDSRTTTQIDGGGERATFAGLAAEGADVEQIVCAAVSTWRHIYAALAPVIGKRGVAALYERSLHLVRAEYPWLTSVYEREVELGAFRPLQAVLALQTHSDAAATQGALLHAFADGLSTLIGGSLTDRLLHGAADKPTFAASSP
jgi:hypothetical protein